MDLPKNLSAALCAIYTQLGADMLKNPDRLTAVFTDMAPNLKAERAQIDILVKSGCVKKLAAAHGQSADEVKIATEASVEILSNTYLMAPDKAEFLCRTYLCALSGNIHSPGTPIAPPPEPIPKKVAKPVAPVTPTPRKESTPTAAVTPASKPSNTSQSQPKKSVGAIIMLCLLPFFAYVGHYAESYGQDADARAAITVFTALFSAFFIWRLCRKRKNSAPSSTTEAAASASAPVAQSSNPAKKAKPTRAKWLWSIPVILLLVLGYWGSVYDNFTTNLHARNFTEAQQHFNQLPFGQAFFSSESAYLKAGLLWENGKYLEAYQAMQKIDSATVPTAVIRELRAEVYNIGQTKYHEGLYAESMEYFNAIPDYKRSSDYLVLAECADNPEQATVHYDKLLELLYDKFEINDVAGTILTNSSLLEMFLLSRWENGATSDSYYFSLFENGDSLRATYNLPHEQNEGYFWLSLGRFCVGQTEDTAKFVFSFHIIDADTIQVYCFSNDSTYELYRR